MSIKTILSNDEKVKITIVKDTEWNQFVVKWYDLRASGKSYVINPDQCYETMGCDELAKDDAEDTRTTIMNKYNEAHVVKTFTAVSGAYGPKDLEDELGSDLFQLWMRHGGQEVTVTDINEVDGYCTVTFADGFYIDMCSMECIN